MPLSGQCGRFWVVLKEEDKMGMREERWTAAEPEQFRHRCLGRVRSREVDRQGIVNNAVYLGWLEDARVEYFRELGVPIDERTFVTQHCFVVARIEIDYHRAARFDQEYEVLTRVSYVGHSSLGFEQIVRQLPEKLLLARARTVMVYLNPATQRPERIPDAYRGLVRRYEGEGVRIE